MTKTYIESTGPETITVTADSGATARITVEDANGQATITLPASQLRDFMTALGIFVEPYPGAWSKLKPEDCD